MPAPRFLGYPALLGEPKPINWNGIGQALWDTNINAPIRGFYNLMNTPYDVLMGSDSPEKQQAVADSFDAAGGITVGSMPMPKPANSLSMGIKAYHGSPHSFDKFDMSKIGTGEGAQSFGNGLYFAEAENVAKTYRPGKWQSEYFMPDGKPMLSAYEKATNIGDYGAAAAYERIMLHEPRARIEQYFAEGAAEGDKQSLRALDVVKSLPDSVFAKPDGSMYEVNINADPKDFLDWDKSFNDQPQAVKDLMRDELKRQGYLGPNDNGPRQLNAAVKAWKMEKGGMSDTPVQSLIFGQGDIADGTPAGVAQMLNEKGIPGIKYLDANSRPKGRGTRNYVVFDDNLISIVRKYGIAGASAMLGYNLLEGVDKAQAAELQKADTHHQYTNWLSSGGI